jgi:NAD(P)-dependent dehydrogenase (short-subunit alcohol dehydrogenase family)
MHSLVSPESQLFSLIHGSQGGLTAHQNLNPSTEVLYVPCELTNEIQVSYLATKILEVFGCLDVLVDNVRQHNTRLRGRCYSLQHRSDTFPQGLLERSTEEFQHVFNTNLLRAYLLTRHMLPLLILKYTRGNKAIGNVGIRLSR